MNKKRNIKSLKRNKKLHVFFIFLGVSTLLWTVSKLSKEYTHTVNLTTNYINFSNDKELQNEPEKTLDVVMKTTGFSLLNYNLFHKKINIDLKLLQKNKNKYYYNTNKNLSSLQAQFPIDETLLRVYPDTIFFDFGKLGKKKIDVKTHINIEYKSGYNLVGSLEINPKIITINGTEDQIKIINEINSKPLNLKNVKDSFEYTVALDIPKEYNKINFSTKEITIKGIVEKFTESSKNVSFELINVPKNHSIKTFIDKVKVTYKVSLENFDRISESDFQIICDYNKVKNLNTEFLIPEIIKSPDLVSNIKLSPNKIEFLIKK